LSTEISSHPIFCLMNLEHRCWSILVNPKFFQMLIVALTAPNKWTLLLQSRAHIHFCLQNAAIWPNNASLSTR
jgi:hypothetical protein